MKADAVLMVGDTVRDANLLYAVRMFVPDPFIYLQIKGKHYCVLSDLEIDRARKQAPHCHCISLSQWQESLRKDGIEQPGFGHVIRGILRERGIENIFVPHNFPFGLASDLKRLGISMKALERECFPQREQKSVNEIKKISAALMMAEVGLAEGLQALKRSKVAKNGHLVYGSGTLTSERLRAVIDTAILQAGGLPMHTIVAGGTQGCDPHEIGHGPLRANQPIILDVFPRSQKTGYFGDITRTVVKGRASEAVRNLYQAVAKAQAIAFEALSPGVSGRAIHQKVDEHFQSEGFKTGNAKGRMEGFFHGTGHGVGLEIHEAPRISKTSPDTLRFGHVITIEPGLYYHGIGGVRLEDMAAIGRNASRNLTKFEKVLEI